MKHYWLIFLLSISFSVNAQKLELIKGKWKFKDLADKQKLDSMTIKTATIGFGNLTLEFLPEGKLMYNTLEGTWVLDKPETKVSITMKNPLTGKSTPSADWGITAVTKKELKLNMGKAVVIFEKIVTTTPVTTASATKTTEEISPFEVTTFVRTNSAKDLLAYLKKKGNTYTSSVSPKGYIEYKFSGTFEYGVENFTDAKEEGLAISYTFKDRAQKTQYMNKLKEEGFVTIELSSISGTLRKDGVDIWISTLGLTWIISKTSGN